jgi:hypothetical protein
VGQDISIVERLMRGLSQAADENSKEGDKARATLQRMGIDLHTAAGEMKPTSEILVEISEGLNKLPEGLQRDAAAMDLFKRVGVEAIPFMTELNENLRIAHEQGFGPTEADVRRFQEYQREVAQLETKWDALVRKFKEGLVITVSWVGKGVDWFLNNVGTAGDDERERREEEQARQDAAAVRAAGGYGASMSRTAHSREMADLERRAPDIMRDREATLKRMEDLRTQQQNLVGNFGWVQFLAPTEEELGRMRKAADIEKEIDGLQHMLDAAEQATRRTDLRAGKEETDRLRARFFGTHEGMEKAYSDAKKDVEKYQKELFEPEKPLTRTEVLDLSGKLRTSQGTEARWKAALDAEATSKQEAGAWDRQLEEQQKRGAEAGLDAIGKLTRERDQFLAQGEKLHKSEEELAAARKAFDDQILEESVKEHVKELNKEIDEQNKLIHQHVEELNRDLAEQRRHDEQVERTRQRIESINVQAQREMIQREATRAGHVAELTAGSEEDAAQQAYQVRVKLALDLAGIEAVRIARETDANEKAVLAAQAQKDLFTALVQAQDQFDEKTEQIQQKRQQDLQRQVDELQKVSSGLLHTLFTKPGEFPKQLGSTIREAMLKPVTEGLGGMIASAIHPLIYGSDGQGGLAGIFHGAFGGGKQDPVKVSTDLNTAATMQNSAVIATLTTVLAGFMGMGAPAIAASGIPGISGLSVPSISMPVHASGAFSPFSLTLGGVSGYPSATSSSVPTGGYSPAPWASPGGYSAAPWASGGMNPLAMILRGGSSTQGGTAGANSLFSKGGFSQTLSNLKSAVWNQDAWNAYPSTTGGYIAGGIEGVASSPAAGAAGLSLATHGLISNAGTWTGAIQGAAGGALIGNQIGGPLGAAAGASFGFEIGALEKLFGVKSLNQTAHDDIKSVYGIDIPTNSGTIKQVVDIAKQQFGGSISVAVRSPSVRQLVMLYSEATGQKMPLSATTPYAGSLVEQGGNLYQQASFQNNAWHMYSSNLPTLGGIGGSTYPTPGGPNTAAGAGATYLSLNISGSDAANFMTGQYVTPQFVTDQALAAQYSSYGRTQQSANMQLPGLTVA